MIGTIRYANTFSKQIKNYKMLNICHCNYEFSNRDIVAHHQEVSRRFFSVRRVDA